MAEDIIDLFADGPDTSLLVAAGHYIGKENIRDFFHHGRKDIEMRKSDNGEFLHQVMQLSGVVDVDPGGPTAAPRKRCIPPGLSAPPTLITPFPAGKRSGKVR